MNLTDAFNKYNLKLISIGALFNNRTHYKLYNPNSFVLCSFHAIEDVFICEEKKSIGNLKKNFRRFTKLK